MSPTSGRRKKAPAPRRPATSARAPAKAAVAPAAKPRPWSELSAADIMRRSIVTVDESQPLSEVERVLTENRISGAPVTDEAGRIVGVVTLRDLVEHYEEEPETRPARAPGFFHVSSEELEDEDLEAVGVPAETEDTAADIMTAQIFSVPTSAPLARIAADMTRHRIHRVLVEEKGRYVGIISTFEILGALAANRP